MFRSIAAAALLISLARAGTAQAIDQAKLREAIKMPALSVSFPFEVNLHSDFGDRQDPAVQIAALQKALRGDPSDAAIYVKIGNIYRAKPLKDDKQAQAAYRKAIPLFRRQLEKQPRNGGAMAQLGRSLFDAAQYAEAEKVLRESVLVAPKDWHTWAELGQFVQNHSLILFGKNSLAGADIEDIAAAQQGLEQALPEQIALLRKADTEAHADFDRAVALNPESPEPYEDRAGFFIGHILIVKMGRSTPGETSDAAGTILPETRNDLWKAAGLVPDDPARQASAAVCEMLHLLETAGESVKPVQPGALDRMPPASRDHIRVLMERLRKSAEDKDPHKAKIAAVALTNISLFSGETAEAERMAKRSLALDPNSRAAWETLCAVYISAHRFKEFAAVEEERLKHDDTPYNRLMLAKSYDRLSNTALASETTFSAVKRFPDDLLLNLAAVDVLLKRPEADALKQAAVSMAHAETLFAKMSEEDRKASRINLYLTRGGYHALTGKVQFAKEMLQSVLAEEPDNEEAKSLIAVLNGDP